MSKNIASGKEPQIEFVGVSPARGFSGGGRAGSYYIFQVDGKETAVAISRAAQMTLYGILPAEKVRIAAQAFLEGELGRHKIGNLPKSLVLNEAAMDLVLRRLGWPPRFGQKP